MAKARKRRQAAAKKRTMQSATLTQANSPQSPVSTTATVPQGGQRRRGQSTQAPNMQSLFMPGLVVLGFWGLAFTFTFLSNEPNHVLFGGLSLLMAVGWTASFVLRVRKLLRYRS